MSRTVSPSSKKPYGVARVVRLWDLARSSFYAARHRERHPRETQKRGPKVFSDAELVTAIRQLLEEAVFSGEGYRKIWARLRQQGIRTSKGRVLQLLRENQLLSPARQPEPVRSHPHEGTIIAERPNQMWGTDATTTVTGAEGTVTVFAAIDHCTAECVGIHVVKKATRFEALEPIRQRIKEQFGAFSGDIAAGLWLRHDHGSRLHERGFSERDSLPGHRALSGFRAAAGRKRMYRALLSHPQRAVTLDPPFSRSRRASRGAHRVPDPL